MNELPRARISPRIVNGVLRWYHGDTFDFNILLDLVDQDDVEIVISDTDSVEAIFKDRRRKTVTEFCFTNIKDNSITLSFDEDITELFDAGEYTYDVYYISNDRRVTLADNNPVVVEGGY